MPTTITDGTTTITPQLVRCFKSARPSNTVIHEVVGSPSPSATLRPAGLRTGTLEALFATMAEAFTCDTLLAQAKTFTLTVSTATARTMTFVTTGEITIDLDRDTGTLWAVTTGFQEVNP